MGANTGWSQKIFRIYTLILLSQSVVGKDKLYVLRAVGTFVPTFSPFYSANFWPISVNFFLFDRYSSLDCPYYFLLPNKTLKILLFSIKNDENHENEKLQI